MSYFVRLLGHVLFILWAVTTLVFLMLHLVPGDPVAVMLGEQATPADQAALRAQLGLDLPLWTQYLHYLLDVVQKTFARLLDDHQIDIRPGARFVCRQRAQKYDLLRLILGAQQGGIALQFRLPLGATMEQGR